MRTAASSTQDDGTVQGGVLVLSPGATPGPTGSQDVGGGLPITGMSGLGTALLVGILVLIAGIALLRLARRLRDRTA
jgi:hypothetical protein